MKKLSLEALNRLSVEEYQERGKVPIVVVLDNVRSALNVGSAFRTGDAFAIEKILLCGITATPPHREILKTAIGATKSVVWEHCQETLTGVRALKAQGYEVLAVEQAEGSEQLSDFGRQADKKYALIFGNEVAGVAQTVMDEVDGCLEIPQYGTKHSLNISVSIGIVLWEFIRNSKVNR